MSSLRGFRDGVAVGLVVGFLVAPRRGSETRARLSATVQRTEAQARRLSFRAQRGWHTARPALERAGEVAGGLVRTVQPVAQGAGGRLGEIVSQRRGAGSFAGNGSPGPGAGGPPTP